jgi:hypothetical protein
MYTLDVMHESSLHMALKQFYIQDGGFSEWWLDGYWIDVYQRGQLIEIQTGNFGSLRSKLESLLEEFPIRLVYPIPRQRFIVMRDQDQTLLWRRRSPKRGRYEDLFNELVYIVQFVRHPNFSLEVLITSEEEQRQKDGLGSWRRRGVSILDRRLIGILDRSLFLEPSDYSRFLDPVTSQQFTNRDLASQLSISNRLAAKITYCLSQFGLIDKIGKRRNAFLFQKTDCA